MCGVIGIYGPEDVSEQIFFAMRGSKHRGRSGAGIITFDGSNIFSKKTGFTVDELMSLDELKHYEGNVGLGHTRYSTSGSDDLDELKRNAQPEYIINPLLAASHNGNIYNYKEVLSNLKRKPRTGCDIQALLLSMHNELKKHNKINEETVIDSSEEILSEIKGSFSADFITSEDDTPSLFALTDPYKVRPLVVGKKKDKNSDKNFWYVVSETSVLKRLGAEYVMDVPGGSVLFVNPEWDEPRYKTIVKKKPWHCMFEWVYFADRNSEINGVSVHNVRRIIGERLAVEHPADADIVIPVPESGRAYAIGFSYKSGIPLEEGLVKYEKTRTFILQTQQERDKEAEHNIEAIDIAVKDKKVVLVDDSQIRGTNMRKYIKKLRKAGAKEVHVRIGCPPVLSPCYLGIDMRSKNEFIARKEDGDLKSWDKIAEEINADSLGYGSMETLNKAIKGSRDDFEICTGCLRKIPDGYPPCMRDDVLELFSRDRGDGRAYEF